MKNQQRFLVSVSGFSGSGKSFLAKFLSELFDFPLVSLTKIVGTKLENMFPQMKNLDVVERIEFGYNYVLEINKRFPAEILMEYCKNNSPYSTGLIIDGVKNPKDVSLLLTDFTLYLPIFVVSGYNTRIERIMKRDKLAKNSAERYLIKRDYMDIKVGILEMFKNAEILVLNEIESERQINPSLSILGSIVKKKVKDRKYTFQINL